MQRVGLEIIFMTKKKQSEIITLQAIFQSARTTVDGGIRVSFDIDASQVSLLPYLLSKQHQRLNIAIQADEEPEALKEGYGYLSDL
jgi:hypothetical protein